MSVCTLTDLVIGEERAKRQCGWVRRRVFRSGMLVVWEARS